MEQHSFSYKEELINYILIRRGQRNIRIGVRDGVVRVSAPFTVPLAQIEGFVDVKAGEIVKLLRQHTPAARLLSGAQIMYMGEWYELKVIKSESANSVDEVSKNLVIFTDEPENYEKNQDIYIDFLRKRGQILFAELAAELYPLIEPMGAPFPKLKLRRMISRWGSCVPANNSITFNVFLMAAPIEAIKYVVLHELLHLVFNNHKPEFWQALGELMPDYERHKDYLNEQLRPEVVVQIDNAYI
ncbi:MAG: M48 family metallopeptidase [Oscillospiraceae bacterium]|nr:M48 family metallopeptidase [Oscillospiraceae bacterium]